MRSWSIIPPLGTPLNRGVSTCNNLLHYYPLNEGGGNIARDIAVGNSNFNGTLTNGATWAGSEFGKVLSLDGTDDYVECNFVPTGSVDFSFGGWGASAVKVSAFSNRLCGNADSTGGLTGCCIICNCAAGNQGYSARRNGANNGTRDIASVSTPNSNDATKWHHWLVTYSTTNGLTLYYDGRSVGTNATTGFTSSLPFRIGKDGNGSDAFAGKIWGIGYWGRCLPATEVKRLFVEPFHMFISKKSRL